MTATDSETDTPAGALDTSYLFCIPTIRMREAADTIRAYDHNFTRYKHNVPVIVFLDAWPPEDGEQNPRFPEYWNDYEALKKAAAECHNDVFIVTRDQQNTLKMRLGERLKQTYSGTDLDDHIDAERIDNVLDKMLGGSVGGIKNLMLLYTLGSRILMVDDDIRPFEMTSSNHNFLSMVGLAAGGKHAGVMGGTFASSIDLVEKPELTFRGKRMHIKGGVFDALSDFIPRKHRPFSRRGRLKGLKVHSVDVLSAYFSLLGLPIQQITSQYPDIMTGDRVSYSGNEDATNTGKSNYAHMTQFLDEAYSFNQDNAEGNQTSMHVRDEFVPESPAKVKLVQSVLTGAPDGGDALDFLRDIIEDPAMNGKHYQTNNPFIIFTSMWERNHNPSILNRGFALNGGILGIDNSSGNMGSFIRGLRKEEMGLRLRSLDKDCLTAQLHIGQTHLRSPDRQDIAKAVYQEELGVCMQVMLLNNRKEDGSYERNTRPDPVMTTAMCENGEKWYNKILEAIEECGATETDQDLGIPE